MFLLKDTMQWHRWGSNPLPFGLEFSTLPLNHSNSQLSSLNLFNTTDLKTGLGKQCRFRWDGLFWAISSVSTLFAYSFCFFPQSQFLQGFFQNLSYTPLLTHWTLLQFKVEELTCTKQRITSTLLRWVLNLAPWCQVQHSTTESCTVFCQGCVFAPFDT